MAQFSIQLVWAQMIAPGVRHLAFRREDGQSFSFIPGQFITLHLPSGDKHLKRSYSIATIPGGDQEYIEFAASYVSGGLASEILFDLKEGETLSAEGPFGRLILREDHPKRYILVATGTGVTPYRSMLPQLSDLLSKQAVDVVILEGVRLREDLLYPDAFLETARRYPNFEFRAYFSRDPLADRQSHEYSGYVQNAFEDLQLNPSEDVVYLCGNPAMVDQSFENLKTRGFDIQQIRREKYISSGSR